MEKRKCQWEGLKITQFVSGDWFCSLAQQATGEVAGLVWFDRRRDANQSEGLQKEGGQERKKFIGNRAQSFGELGGSGSCADVFKRIQRDRG